MQATVDPVLYDATLRPNPPMAASALKGIVVAVGLVNLVFAVTFVLRGAWPVTPFMGADVLLLAWAFRAVTRAAKRYERIQLTRANLLVARYPVRGDPSKVELNPYWVRVELEEPPQPTSRLTLHSHGRSVQIGAFLPAEERLSVAQSLRAALRRARETLPD
jgi:uncharacterized membrane protein